LSLSEQAAWGCPRRLSSIVSSYVENVEARGKVGGISQGSRSEASLAASTNAIAGHVIGDSFIIIYHKDQEAKDRRNDS
jgi:hypothetical protein